MGWGVLRSYYYTGVPAGTHTFSDEFFIFEERFGSACVSCTGFTGCGKSPFRCRSERSEGSAFSQTARKKQIPRANPAPGMTNLEFFRSLFSQWNFGQASSDFHGGKAAPLYRSRPGGSAEGGIEGVAEGAPEFAETLEGAG
jgi:hypothetical protein